MITNRQLELARNFLSDAFQNLVIESIKFMPQGDEDLCFYVAVNTKPDIDNEEYLDHLMEPLLEIIPFIVDKSAPMVFLEHRGKTIYSWMGHP